MTEFSILLQEYQDYKQAYHRVVHSYADLCAYDKNDSLLTLGDGCSQGPESEFSNNLFEIDTLFMAVNRGSEYLAQAERDFKRFCQPGEPLKIKKKRRTRSGGRALDIPKLPFEPTSQRDLSIMLACDITFVWPISRQLFWISSLFGPRKKANGKWGFHYGLDMAACKGTPVMASASGTVKKVGMHPGYGNLIEIEHSRIYTTRYAHLDSYNVVVGQVVDRGMVIGAVGNTGNVRGKTGQEGAHHLHLEVIVQSKRINPLRVLR